MKAKFVKEYLFEAKGDKLSKSIEGVREGPLRKEERDDGWWVLGAGNVISAKDEKAADRIIKKIKENENCKRTFK